MPGYILAIRSIYGSAECATLDYVGPYKRAVPRHFLDPEG
jgi:hypothetical protein